MNKATELVVDAGVGAVASEILKVVITEAKLVLAFKSVSKDLASTMEELVPIVREIEQTQGVEEVEELKTLKDTIDKARVVVEECKSVKKWEIHLKHYYTRRVYKINKKMLDFCQVQLPLILLRNQGKHSLTLEAINICIRTIYKFNHIFYSLVSGTPNFRKIVQNLLQHNGYEAVTFENDPQAANALIDLIEELTEDGPVLLVLDDVWLGADDFLKYFRFKLPGYKILVTSRSDLPSFDYTYPLQPLNEKDAKALLLHVAPRPYNAPQAEYEELLQKILKRCSGLPLVIEVVGVPLKGKPLYYWKGQVGSWSEGKTILRNPRPSVLECLEPSFTALEPHLKDCFMDMGSFLEDQKIRASVIIDIWVELYGKGTPDSSFEYMKYLHDLASQNLLRLIPLGRNDHEDCFYNELLVTQHDILRELAIHESKSEAVLERKRLSLVIQGDDYPDLSLSKRESTRFLSVSADDLFSSSWEEMDSFQFPNVEALLLNISSSNYALPRFIDTMQKLKVVIIINHGPGPAILTNLSCLSSLKKLKRIRLDKVSITFLDILQLQLVSLKKLSLFMCCFGEVSHDKNEIDVSKALSSLQEMDLDYCYDLEKLPNWISEAVSLEKLSITNCNKLSMLPKAIGNLSKLEVLRLSSCISLSELPETTARLNNLQFLDLSDCLGLRKLPLEIGRLEKLKKISMNKCWKCELPDSVRNLENLEVKCDEETAVVLWKLLKLKMRNLDVQVEETEHNLNLLRHCH
ncbi:unnamed protein product [Brassica rapa]|uniref:RPW8 domain-containing protein n=2 Tax=Brassica TaxID=3705 RepID=A0A3P6AZZ2_BRACM|nr:unnamed protein product [Brassica napus]CAG7902240.1 unnamed protein product [Brassica rapa]VDC98242.1 unnamed protein product [Brassica rapa]